MATQEQVNREPWLLQTDMGMSLFNRASNIANAFAQEGNKQTCGEIMKLMGSYDGLTSKFKTYCPLSPSYHFTLLSYPSFTTAV